LLDEEKGKSSFLEKKEAKNFCQFGRSSLPEAWQFLTDKVFLLLFFHKKKILSSS